MFNLGQDIGIDLGTATVIAYVKGKGVVLREPSVVAVDNNTKEVLAVGQEARRMLGRTPGNIVATRPLREGVISDYTVTEKMLKYFINKVNGKGLFSPRTMICIPSRVTEVEKKAVIDAATQAGARKVFLIEEPIAAAIGAGIDIAKPCGNMIVDIGGGTTDVAVISLGGSVESTSLKIAGDKFDEAIVKYIKKKHNIMIGERTAEDLKINIGCVYPKIQDVDMDGYLVSVMDYQHVRPVLTITALNNICNTILTVSKVYRHDVSEEPEFFIFSGAAGQEQDITSIGDTLECSREDAVQAGYDEVLYQLKKYFQIPGVVMASGLFTVQSISYPEYQLELEERELILD